MAISSRPSTNGDTEASVTENSAAQAGSPPDKSPHRMSTRTRLLFYLTAWLIVLLPFLFWWNTWFGRQLSDQQVTQYLADDKHPRHIQHALVQIGERIARRDALAARWYPELIRLATHPVEEVRNTDAWVMGQDTAGAGFHDALLKMLQDSSPMVRGNAALSLVRFKDDSGRAEIVALLQPAHIVAPRSGRVADTARVGTAIRQGGIVAKLQPATPRTRAASAARSVSKSARRSAAASTRSAPQLVPSLPLAPKSPPSIPATNRSGKPCARCISSAALTICPRFVLMNAKRATFPIASASKPCSPTKPSAPAPPPNRN